MDSVAGVNGQSAVSAGSGKPKQSLNNDDFMKLMITELTNQNPFEPMKNQDLVNQMATMQQMQSSKEMGDSFKKLMKQYDAVLSQQQISTAAGMVGELVSGVTDAGQNAVGKVVSVNVDGGNVFLELDSGQRVNMKDVKRLGGSNSQDIVNKMAIGTMPDGSRVVGKVTAVEAGKDGLILHMKVAGSDDEVVVPLKKASIIDPDNADLLIGYNAEGANGVSGTIQSVEWSATKVMLNILNGEGKTEQLPLDELVGIS